MTYRGPVALAGQVAGDVAVVVFVASGVLLVICSTWALALWLRRDRWPMIARLLLAVGVLLALCVASFVIGAT